MRLHGMVWTPMATSLLYSMKRAREITIEVLTAMWSSSSCRVAKTAATISKGLAFQQFVAATKLLSNVAPTGTEPMLSGSVMVQLSLAFRALEPNLSAPLLEEAKADQTPH